MNICIPCLHRPWRVFHVWPVRRIFHQLFHPRFIRCALLGREGLAIDEQSAGDLALFGVDHVAVLAALFVFTMNAETPTRMVSGIRFQLLLDRFLTSWFASLEAEAECLWQQYGPRIAMPRLARNKNIAGAPGELKLLINEPKADNLIRRRKSSS